MARITVEGCLVQPDMDNAFNLVLTAAKRARQLRDGGESFVSAEDDKLTVIALREIEAGQVTTSSVEKYDDLSNDKLSKFSGLEEQPGITPIGFEEEEDAEEADEEIEAKVAVDAGSAEGADGAKQQASEVPATD